MKTHMECRSLGENPSNYTTNSSIRQIKQKPATSSKQKSGAGLALGLVAGAAVGALAGVLLAPDKGDVTRKKVADSASKIGDKVNKGYVAGKDKASAWTDKLTNKSGTTNAHVNKAPNLPATESSGKPMTTTMGGEVKKSPYTDPNKWDDQEVKNMTNTAKNTPGV